MQLVVDASVLVAELLRVEGRRRIADPRLELFLAEYTWGEVQHEVPRRAQLFGERHGLAAPMVKDLVEACPGAVREAVAIVPEVAYSPLEEEARWRSPQDPADWPSVALALALDAAIWTEDRDFFGIGVAVWSTATVRAWLERHQES